MKQASESYLDFLESKIVLAPESGFTIDESELSPALKPHQKAAVLWALKGGRRGYTIELNDGYFRDAVGYLKELDECEETISLFDLVEGPGKAV